MNKKGFIFDLDGVIVNTAKYLYLAWKNYQKVLEFILMNYKTSDLKV